ncbi:MAG: hypothetical protein HQ594_04945 [Candidatus Omnitrophica bacterium]|nr:hypothetical protein [Candidatus Omnitrophota bacterium]
MKKLFTLISILIFLSGCATSPSFQTPSGKPEVTVARATKKEVTDYLRDMMTGNGYNARVVGGEKAVYTKAIFGFKDDTSFSDESSSGEEIITYTFSDTPGGVQVIGEVEQIKKVGSNPRQSIGWGHYASAETVYGWLITMQDDLKK